MGGNTVPAMHPIVPRLRAGVNLASGWPRSRPETVLLPSQGRETPAGAPNHAPRFDTMLQER
mgnify:CR=1 FL=1